MEVGIFPFPVNSLLEKKYAIKRKRVAQWALDERDGGGRKEENATEHRN